MTKTDEVRALAHTLLRRRLLRYHGRDVLLIELRGFVRYGGELSARQAAEAERRLANDGQ